MTHKSACTALSATTPKLSADSKSAVSFKQLLFIFIAAAAAITICSKSSPIYPFNDWGDANCFMTVGKSMLHGLVPYRDLYEQKGPLLYMLHALAAIVCDTTFTGVFFIEVIAASFFLFFSYKLIKLYVPSADILLVPIIAAVVYSARSFCHGDSAEELCLPMFAFAIYTAIKSIKQEKLPARAESVAVGITFAFVLWIKYSMLGFYIGWFAVIAWQAIKHSNAKKLFEMTFWIGIGILIPTVPILIYFSANNALADLWRVYFCDNLFLYSNSVNHFSLLIFSKNMLSGIKNIFTENLIPAILILTGLLLLMRKKDKTEFFSYLIMGVFTFLFVYGGGRHYNYYALIFSAFVPIGIVSICKIIKRIAPENIRAAKVFRIPRIFSAGIVCALSIVFAFVMCGNTYLLRYDKSDMPQYKFAEIISKTDNATLLNYGFLDGGFYTATGIVPNCKFFCNLNIKLDEIMETQNEFIKNGKVDFIVTSNSKLEAELYECVATASIFYEGYEYEYRLYQLISEKNTSDNQLFRTNKIQIIKWR